MAAKHVLAMLVGAAMFNLSTPAHAQDQTVSGEEIKTTWVGKKIFARSSKGGLIDLYLRADGTSEVSVGKMIDTGTWRPTETGYCAKWQKIRAGEERCLNVVDRGGKLLVLEPDGSLNTEIIRIGD